MQQRKRSDGCGGCSGGWSDGNGGWSSSSSSSKPNTPLLLLTVPQLLMRLAAAWQRVWEQPLKKRRRQFSNMQLKKGRSP